jgi:hypothetical protein
MLTVSARRMEELSDAVDELRAAGAVEVHPVVANLAHHDEVAGNVDEHANVTPRWIC